MRKKYMLAVFLIIVLAGAGVGIWMWNMPHRKAENVTGVSISIDSLCGAYEHSEDSANGRFLNKALVITGKAHEVIHNLDGGVIAVLRDSVFDVQCALRDTGALITEGQKITVKGFCTGKTIAGVSLTDCILIQP